MSRDIGELLAADGDWDLSSELGDTIFSFVPPEGAEQVEFANRDAERGE